jgi:signal transduction histidine kinase
MIERQVDRMDRLVTDLLDVSRIGRGTFALRKARFDLASAVRDTVRRATEATADDERHSFEVEVPPSLEIDGDEQRVGQVLMSLIDNAVKFSPRGGTVRVALESAGGAACVTVRDEGIGIPADEIARLGREPYVRGRAADGYAGLGVGLYLSRLIAEAHGGRIDVESAGTDQGTTARLTLPR